MFANRFTAVIDACVLFSPLKRNLILSLAEAELFRVRWSAEILDETRDATEEFFQKKGCLDWEDRSERAVQAMCQAFDDAIVSDFEELGSKIGELPDEGDRHVIAAAIKCKADVIVTENTKDFPRDILERYGIEAKTADEFIADAIDLNAGLALAAIKKMRLRLKNPAKTSEALLLDLEKCGLTLAADQIRDSVRLI